MQTMLFPPLNTPHLAFQNNNKNYNNNNNNNNKTSCQVSGLKGLLRLARLRFLCGPLKGLKPKVN